MSAWIVTLSLIAGLAQAAPGFEEPNFRLALVDEALKDRTFYASFASASYRYGLWSDASGPASAEIVEFRPDPHNPLLGEAHLFLSPGDYRIVAHPVVFALDPSGQPPASGTTVEQFKIEAGEAVSVICTAHGTPQCTVRTAPAPDELTPWL